MNGQRARPLMRGVAALALTMEFSQDGRTIGHATPELPAPDEQGRIAYVASFPTSGFAPGTYELKAIARQGESEDESRTTFTVVP